MAEFPCVIIGGILNQEAKDDPRLIVTLDEIFKRLQKDTLRTTGELACIVSIPALSSPRTESMARNVTELAAKNLNNGAAGDGVLTNVLFVLARHNLDRKDIDGAKKNLQDYLAANDRIQNGNAEYSSYTQANRLAKGRGRVYPRGFTCRRHGDDGPGG